MLEKKKAIAAKSSDGIIVGLIGARLKKPNFMEYQELVVTEENLNQRIKETEDADTTAAVAEKQSPDFCEEQSKHNPAKSQVATTAHAIKDAIMQPLRRIFYGPEKIGGAEEQAVKESTKQLFLDFYGEKLKYDPQTPTKFYRLRNGVYFNNEVYKKRLALSIDTLLIEANARAKVTNQMAFVYVVGIGLGLWKMSSHQDAIFMDTFAKRIGFLSSTLTHISDVCFSYIKHTSCGEYKNGDTFPIEGHQNNGIRIHILKREPHEKLQEACEGNLLVASYAWDGNSLPGNEFWAGELDSSGDPAAACSTQVAELHNAHINPRLRGAHLRIATLQGLVTLGEYVERLKNLPQNP